MNCSFDKEKLSGYYDGELAAAEKAEVERHIASCSECLRDLGELKSAALLVKDLPRLRAPKSIAEGVSREIQAAGRRQSLVKVRRLVLWASAAAAGLFVLLNVVYLSSQKSAAPALGPEAPMARSAAKVPPAEPQRAAEPTIVQPEAKEADRALALDTGARRQLDAARKNLAESGDKAAPDATVEESRKSVPAKARAAAPEAPKPAEGLAKSEAAPPAPVPAAAPPPAPTAKPAAPASAPEAAKTESTPLADREKAAAKESEGLRKAEPDPKGKVAASAAPPVELPPAQYNVVTKELAKARPRIEESLKKMGVVPSPPPAKPSRSREAENTLVLELTDAQLLRLRDELEKPGDARMVPATSVEPVLPGFRGGGLFAKKDNALGGAKAPVPAAKDEDAKDGKELAAGPRRKVTLHLVESKTLPPAESDPVPPQKN